MRAKLTVIIPTLNAEATLPVCLAALFEGVEAGLIRELLISDGGSGDATAQIADEVGAELVTGTASRGGQLRRGAAMARGEWLLILHADTRLAPGWSAAVAAAMAAGRPGYFKLRFDAPGLAPRLVAGWANLRARLFGLPYGDQGLLISRRAYEAAGGYPDIPLMEDVALVRKLPRLTRIEAEALTGAEKYLRDGWLRRGAGNLWRLTRYLLGADPNRLARKY
ncbi:TIGR04283 family arsenosugar biosynthesis glycosyltransferase [Roseovarius nubinhibens]|uniref:Glycosyl transferase, group 2 family protein n=1 Tax=Roseovarius nubinhibens (strain ATCC BAA-591 / DSM 15170 / ISM) TaxID=89187 RepID=A3SK54_ROSNI|nr:TIGR04283 family arsenosugar biosynthesis glycosyltransferase [Roseovarius nubinhibens]EAP77735.1 glycosyl transferase, group 2 family protein [Roseovarius nubinhibens ISM]